MSSKSMKKADAKLAAAKQYIKDLEEREKRKSATELKQDAYRAKLAEEKRAKPTQKTVKTAASNAPKLYDGRKIDSAEVKKVSKGNFKVIATANGQKFEVPNRFKSSVRAQEWIDKYVK